ncbi:MAG: sugar kinase [Pseudomonadota bacterium]
MTDLLCLGEPLVEFVRMDDGRYQRGFGGDTSNAAIAAARQGAKVGYLTALGKDRFGDGLMELWASEGVDASHIIRNPDAPTGIYFIDPDPAERHFTYYRAGSAASLMQPSDLPNEALSNARCLHLSGITLAVSPDLRATGLAAMQAVRNAGGAVSLDTNLRLKLWDVEEARAVTHAAMAHATIAVTSEDDSAHLTGLKEPAEIAQFYHALGVETVLVTLGAEGCHLSTPGGARRIPPAPANAVDSTGAGDSFAGSFLAWWLETGDPVLAARRAAIVAAGTVSGYGAVDPIPRRAHVLAQSMELTE